MIPELGNFALMLALAIALAQGILPIAGSFNGNRQWMAVARPATAGQFVLITFAFACLVYSFITNDFSVHNVASNSNSNLPIYYRIAASWGSHEGSLLLWAYMLAGWSFAVAALSRQLPDETVARVLGVLGLVSVGFLAFLLFTSNPFDRLLPAAPDGRDLNPLLQDFGMIIHPPLLYMGYVGFSVAFAFAIAALMGGQLDAAWARWSRPWTTIAWMFLTLGIFMGSFWAYYELGWGGWWFWDPVENASFMPWLVGTALIHSLAVTEKRGSFKNWTVLLAIIAFSLSLLGTFLVRSGVLTSVHAFATDPERGTFILIFLAIVIGGSLLLYAWRAPSVGLGGRFALISRESMLLVNNVLLLVACGTVLLGTLYPLFLDALGLGKISVGPPYFEAVFVPLMIPVLLLVGVGPFARWKEHSLSDLLRRLRWVALASVGLAIAIAVVLAASPMVTVGISFAVWIVFTSISHIVERARHAPAGMPLSKRLSREPRSYWAMLIAHAGIGVFVVGVTMVNGFDDAKDVHMRPGDTTSVNGYTFAFSDLQEVKGPNYVAARGTFDITYEGKKLTTLHPEKRMYVVQQMPMTEAGIDRGFTRDLYVSLGESTKDGAWIVRVQHKPFVGWIWGGCLIMSFGGLLAATDRRYRVAARQAKLAAQQAAALKTANA
ncbi:heme lyase CcmF/NrfE family subunit [Noviherbaspirillum agri]